MQIQKNPIILVVGSNQNNKSRIIEDLLTSQKLLSKKFGRIIYIGQRKYKHAHIIQDELNSIQTISYVDIMDMLDVAKTQSIVNCLLVFNTANTNQCNQIFDKIAGIRHTYLLGKISMLINLKQIDQISQNLFKSVTDIILFDSQFQKKIAKKFEIKEITQKKKKQSWWISNKKIYLVQ